MNKLLLTLIVLAALFLAGAAFFAVYNNQRGTTAETPPPATTAEASPKVRPATGDPDQIIDDVVASFNEEAAIASEGDADAAVLSGSDTNVNSLMQQYNENAF